MKPHTIYPTENDGAVQYACPQSKQTYTTPDQKAEVCRYCARPLREMPAARIVLSNQYSYTNRLYRLIAGEKGTGKVLYRHLAGGDYRADDYAVEQCYAAARQFGYRVMGEEK